MRLVQQSEQAPEVPLPVLAQRRLQLGGVPPPGDDVRIGVLLPASRAVQIVDQWLDPISARRGDLPDHRDTFRNATGMRSGLTE